jgi:hypothetical protein
MLGPSWVENPRPLSGDCRIHLLKNSYNELLACLRVHVRTTLQ